MACYSAAGGSSWAGGAGGGSSSSSSNGKVKLFKRSGFNKYGQPSYVSGGIFNVYIVKLASIEQLSSIRTDTSASKSTIDEELYDGEIHMPVKSRVTVGDGIVIQINGEAKNFRVAKATQVFSSTDIDHILVHLTRL